MSTDELRVKVAELQGWKDIRVERIEWADLGGGGEYDGLVGMRSDRPFRDELPNYPTSLDACATFERTLTDEQQDAYYISLVKITGRYLSNPDRVGWLVATATSEQRCRAYVKVMEDGK